MTSREGFQEVVVLFDAAGSKIELEMRLGQFNGLLAQKGTLGSHAARTVKAAYAQVGAGLSLRAAVFFLFKVNEQGYVDPAFNLPLAYMAQNAGEGPELGNGIISMACRSQCPVPWHAINMWEPAGEDKQHSAMLVQKAVWRNRLGLKAVPLTRRANGVSKLGKEDRVQSAEARSVPVEQPVQQPVRQPVQRVVNGSASRSVNGASGTSPDRAEYGSDGTPGRARVRDLEEKLTARFGEAGRVTTTAFTHQTREQVGEMAGQFRAEMERQQQGYLDQIRSCREEIQQLKAALRHEQQRNRRLQQLLRGDV